ncbi:hypothetical protein TTRE_0000708301 [Trichuris trichiura]|uniref:Uncharacterized protein n=1 Tax=Trichuris trichiura TaxID=36087 RepID=A0A077ZGJ5_TRITR|nr:hypothetical protein TTRE_0000708301 [Trichuris trichiura]
MFEPATKGNDPYTAELFKELRSSLQCSRDAYNKWLFEYSLVQLSKAREKSHDTRNMKQLCEEGDALLNSLEDTRSQELVCLKRYKEAEEQLCAAHKIVEILFLKIKSRTAFASCQFLLTTNLGHAFCAGTREALEQSVRCQGTRNALEALKTQALLIRRIQKQISHLRSAGVTIQERTVRRRSTESARAVVKRAQLDELNGMLKILKNESEIGTQKSSAQESKLKEVSSETEFLQRSVKQLGEKLQLVKENSEFLSCILKQAEAENECIVSGASLSDKNIRWFNELVDQQNRMLEEKRKYIDSLGSFHSKQLDSRRNDLSNRLDRFDQVRYEVGRIGEAARFQQFEYQSINAKCVKIKEILCALLLEHEKCIAAAEKAKEELAMAQQRSSMDMSNLMKLKTEISTSKNNEFQLYNSSNMMALYLRRLELENGEVEMEVKTKNETVRNMELRLKEIQIENCSTTRLVMTLKNRLESLSTESPLSSAELSNADGQAERDELETKLKEVVAKQKTLEQDYKQRKSFKRVLEYQAEVEDLKTEISLSTLTYERIRTSQENDLKEKMQKLDERIVRDEIGNPTHREELLAKKRDFDKEKEHLHLRLADLEKEEKLLQAERTAAREKNVTKAAAPTSIMEARTMFFEEEKRKRKNFPEESSGEACARRIQLMYEKGLVPGARKTSRLEAMQNGNELSAWPDDEEEDIGSNRRTRPPRRSVPSTPTKRKMFKAGKFVPDESTTAPWMDGRYLVVVVVVEHVCYQSETFHCGRTERLWEKEPITLGRWPFDSDGVG